jgi:type IV secretion system protein VirD4
MVTGRERAKYIRCFFVAVLILLDLFALPWLLFFPMVVKLHGMARAPALWLRSLSLLGGITLIPRVFQFWSWLQLVVGLLVFLILTSGSGINAGYNPEGDPTPAGQGQFGSSRWQTEKEIDGNFTVRKIPGSVSASGARLSIKNLMSGLFEGRGKR